MYRAPEQRRSAWSLLVIIAMLTLTLTLAACGVIGSGSGPREGQREAEQRVNEGVEALEAGLLDEAVALYSEAIVLDPLLSLAYLRRSQAFGDLGRLTEALQDASMAVEFAPVPEQARAYSNRSKIYFIRGGLDDAVTNASKAIELDRSLAEAYANRGLAYGGLGNVEQAIADLDEALSLTDDLAFGAQIEELLAEMRGQAIPTSAPEPTPEPTPE